MAEPLHPVLYGPETLVVLRVLRNPPRDVVVLNLEALVLSVSQL